MVFPLANEERPRIIPWLTYLLIIANVLCFAFEQIRPVSFVIAYAVTPYEITHGVDIHDSFLYQSEPQAEVLDQATVEVDPVQIHQASGPRPIWLTLLTSLFLHGSLIHLVGNMLFLSIFGEKVEEAFGPVVYLIVYLGSGVLGSWTQVMAVPDSLTPIIGASGAVAGVMGAYLVWFPQDRVRVLFFSILVLVPASGVIASWIVVQLVQSYFASGAVAQVGHVAYLAHLGGVAAGMVGGCLIWLAGWIRSRKRTDQGSAKAQKEGSESHESRS